MAQTLYGLIGAKLGHSYSKIIHEKIADYTYTLLPLPTEAEARAFFAKREFAAVNVTIPYKQLALPCCDEVDPRAKAIGAVNTVVNRGGRLYGYNTDYAGFAYLAKAHSVDFAGKTVLVLGTGGTHATVSAVCRDGGAKGCADRRQHDALRYVPANGAMPAGCGGAASAENGSGRCVQPLCHRVGAARQGSGADGCRRL